MLTNDGAAEGHERPLGLLPLLLHPGSAPRGAPNPPISRDAENRAGPPKDIAISSSQDNAVGALGLEGALEIAKFKTASSKKPMPREVEPHLWLHPQDQGPVSSVLSWHPLLILDSSVSKPRAHRNPVWFSCPFCLTSRHTPS